MPRAVRFDHYGDVDVLNVVEVAVPEPERDKVVVRVRAAGVNTGEVDIRAGRMDSMAPAHFPEGEGSEFSGVVHAVGEGARGLREGDAVLGISDVRNTQADYALVPAENLVAKPEGLGWSLAAATPTAGATAVSIMNTLRLTPGETVVVAGASGGVGVVVTQLAVRAGARVIATASEANHDYLRDLGAEPTTYGDGQQDRIKALAPGGVDAFADCHGGYVELAVNLGVDVDRINTIKDFAGAKKYGAHANGLYQLDDMAGALRPIIADVAAGTVKIPIKAEFPMDQVRRAYQRLSQPGGIGKVVLTVSND